MAKLESLIEADKQLTAVGFDDAPFKRDDDVTGVAGVVLRAEVFEGLLWEDIVVDGLDATETLASMVTASQFSDQLDCVLLDGIAFGGFNVVDVPKLTRLLDVPCMTIMRSRPNWDAIEDALSHVSKSAERLNAMRRAAPVYEGDRVYYQVCGTGQESARVALNRLTIRGNIPEPVRVAHLVASGVKTGASKARA